MARANQLPLPTDAAGIVLVLGDTTDPLAPPKHTIYQVPSVLCFVRGVFVMLPSFGVADGP
jgi:hypothetical protein